MPRALIVEILGNSTGFARELDRAAGKTRQMGKVAGVAGLAIAGGLAVGLEKSVKSAVDFQSSMQLLTTQAGVSETQLDGLKKGVLALAGPTATAPEELSKGIYHLASQGLKGKRALDALRVAAEGAKVGQANLEDVTNALGAAVASRIKGVQNLNQAMGAMNATVGAGDMRMQDLADAMGTGLASNAAVAGVSLKDVDAALAVFGDNNIRGAKAGTALGSVIRLMSAPSNAAAKALGSVGIGVTALANKMRGSGGLPSAIALLKAKMDAAGLSASEQGVLLTRAFGGKQATGVKLLIDEFGRFQSKEKEVGAGASGFGSAWKKTTETTAFKFDQMKESLASVAISLGTVLIPAVTAVAGKLAMLTGWLSMHTAVAKIAIVAIGALATTLMAVSAAIKIATAATTLWTAATKIAALGAKVFAAAQWLVNAAMEANPIVLVATALIALGVAFAVAWEKSRTFREVVKAVFRDVKIAAMDVADFFAHDIPHAAETLKNDVENALREVKHFLSGAWTDVKHLVAAPFNAIQGAAGDGFGVVSALKSAFGSVKGWLSSTFGGLGEAVKAVFVAPIDAIIGAIDAIEVPVGMHIKTWHGIPTGVSVSWGHPFHIPMLAEGGIAMGPTLALIGEKGPEAVVPLGSRGGVGGGGVNVTVHIDSINGTADAQFARQLGQELATQLRGGRVPQLQQALLGH